MATPYTRFFGLFFFTFCICSSIHAQIITTVAGSSASGFSGDGSAATAARIYNPWGVAIDTAGNIYIGDGSNNRVRKVSASGVITTYAGTGSPTYGGDGGPATAAQLNNPSGVALDTFGNLYISDANNHRIRKVTPAGIISTFAGTGTSGFSGDGGPATAAQIVFSDGIASDRFGNVYIPDPANHRIRKIAASGIITTFAGTGSTGTSGDGGPATAATVNYPSDIEVDNAGNVYFTDYQGNIVRKINTSGIISKVAGTGTAAFSGDGGPATAAALSHPVGIDVDDCGNIYLGDALNGRVRKINASGVITTIAGNGAMTFAGDGGAATAASINQPQAICHDGNNNLYIADRLNSRVRKITYPTNNAPYFFHGNSDSFSICIGGAAVNLDSLLAIVDSDAAQTETLSVYYTPLHGTLSGFSASYVSTGGFILPSGLSYMPMTGFFGRDTFRIALSDCLATTIISIYVKIDTMPVVDSIHGVDSVCPGKTVTLTDAIPGGVWSSTNNTIATVSGAGLVTGMSTGLDTIRYVVSNACGADTAIFPIRVRTSASCKEFLMEQYLPEGGLQVYPNPGNGSFTLSLSQAIEESVTVIVSDFLGRKLKEIMLDPHRSSDIQLHLPPGIYTLSATTAHQRFIQKVVVE